MFWTVMFTYKRNNKVHSSGGHKNVYKLWYEPVVTKSEQENTCI